MKLLQLDIDDRGLASLKSSLALTPSADPLWTLAAGVQTSRIETMHANTRSYMTFVHVHVHVGSRGRILDLPRIEPKII